MPLSQLSTHERSTSVSATSELGAQSRVSRENDVAFDFPSLVATEASDSLEVRTCWKEGISERLDYIERRLLPRLSDSLVSAERIEAIKSALAVYDERPIPPHFAERLISDCTPDEAQEHLVAVTRHLCANSTYFDPGIAAGLHGTLQHGLAVSHLPDRVAVTEENNPHNYDGYYSHYTDDITVYEQWPEPEEMLLTLCHRGYLPTAFSTLIHEMIHRSHSSHGMHLLLFEYLKSIQQFAERATPYDKVVDQLEIDVPQEIHALLSERTSPTFQHRSFQTKDIYRYVFRALLPRNGSGYVAPNITREDAMVFVKKAVAAIDATMLLDPSSQRLADAIRREDADFFTCRFPLIERNLDALRQEIGLQSDRRFKRAIKILRFLREVDCLTAQHQARLVTGQALLEGSM